MNRIFARSLSLACLLLVASAAHSVAATKGRLPHAVVPVRQSVFLELDPVERDYRGRVSIELEVTAPSDSFQLNARNQTIEQVSLRAAGGLRRVAYHTAPLERLTFVPTVRMEPGRYALDIRFTQTFNERAAGLYRMETGGESYCFTQFESIDAREAFPCWDEPEFKIPWKMTLVVPARHLAIANTPVESESTQADGRRRVVFRESQPMPSYLVAIATGPLETVPIPGLPVPGRVVTVKGQKTRAAEAVRQTPKLLASLERYFGQPYPYEKLDLLAVPEFWAGAMENVGAIMFADRVLLVDGTGTPQQRRSMAGTVAHELAHMWFGDMVTMDWWDDLWLNESFASWLGDKTVDQVYPSLRAGIRSLSGMEEAFRTDSRLSTRAMRQPVPIDANFDLLGDDLAYDKGQAVLAMFEAWLGEDVFRRGVTAYVKEHAWKNATASDLWRALSAAEGHDVAPVMSSFLDQPGVPLVDVEPLEGGRVRLRQSRFLNFGLTDPKPALWKIPVRLRVANGDSSKVVSFLLAAAETVITLDPPVKPAWIHPNAEQLGYYRWHLPDGGLETLAAAGEKLGLRERMGFVQNLGALLDAGLVHGDRFLAMLEPFVADREPEVVEATLEALDHVRLTMIDVESAPDFRNWIRAKLTPALERIGRAPVSTESPSTSTLRASLDTWLGEHGQDSGVLDWARQTAPKLLADPKAIHPSLATVALQLAAIDGDSTLWEAYRVRFETASAPAERTRYLSALASFRRLSEVERSLKYAIEGPLRPQEIDRLVKPIGADPRYEERVWRWVQANFVTLTERIPRWTWAYLPNYAGSCSPERVEQARKFFLDKSRRSEGMDVTLDQVASRAADCVSLREREGPAVAKYLASTAR